MILSVHFIMSNTYILWLKLHSVGGATVNNVTLPYLTLPMGWEHSSQR